MRRTTQLLAGVILLACGTAHAHKPSDAHLRLTLAGDTLSGRLDIAVRDLDGALGVDANLDGTVTWGELTTAAPQIEAYVTSRVEIAGDGASCPIQLGAPALTELSDGAYWALPVVARCPHVPAALTFRYRLLFDIDAQHRGLVHVAGQTLIIRDSAPARAELGDTTSFGTFVLEGVWHIWIGFDHILFLVCLILPAVFPRRDGRWQPAESLREVGREVLEIVTAFTLAHSITLVIATVGLVSLPSRLVETAIAASVVAAAANNLVRGIDARWAVAFALGLLHGFGFSSVLLDLGLPSHQLVSSLLAFNLGVELGQLAIVLAVLPILYGIRRTLAYQVVMWAGSSTVALLGLLWTYERFVA
ncbi:MAG: HupE/UreJ family protein [Kofleriaceae bacterium]